MHVIFINFYNVLLDKISFLNFLLFYIGGGNMIIYIIGNGFDIGHGLKSEYIDFRNYLKENDRDFLSWFESLYQINSKYLWDALEDNIAYTNLLLAWEYLNKNPGPKYGDLDVNNVFNQVFNHRLSTIEKFPKLFSDWINTLNPDVPRRISSINKNQNNTSFISFNYTRILEETYKIPKDRVFHIHGCVDQENLLFGHGYSNIIDDLINDKKKAIDDNNLKNLTIIESLISYLKFLYKDTSKQIVQLVDFTSKQGTIEKFKVIGSSISSVDQVYFKILDKITGRKVIWEIYYFTKESPYRNQVKSDFKYKLNKATIPDTRIKYISCDKIFDIENIVNYGDNKNFSTKKLEKVL